MRKIVLAATVMFLFIMLGCAIVIFGLSRLASQSESPAAAKAGPSPSPVELATLPPAPSPVIPTVAETSTPQISNSTLDLLLNLDVPRNNPAEIAARLKNSTGAFATPVSPTVFKVGDEETFWVSRDVTGTNQLITATLRYVTPHAYMWLEDGESVSDSGLKDAGDAFENRVYPTDRQYLGSQATLGVDNDPHVFILNTHFKGAFAGYISQTDVYPRSVNPFSNQHKMIYMNMTASRPGTQIYTAYIAHEFAHLIHEHQNPREGSWITEGLGDLAIKLNGFPQDVSPFVQNPDVQLNAWANVSSLMTPHYFAAYLFLSYCLNRFGPDFIRDVVASGTHDIYTIQSALDKHAAGLKFDDLFGDWVIANYVNDHSAGARYSYLDRSLGIRPEEDVSQYPFTHQGSVHQYGASYIQLEPTGHDVSFTFSGASKVQAIPTNPHSGKSMWWGNRVDNSDTTLTKEFDLTTVSKATLTFWAWYDMDPNFDYGYVEASTDDGKSWSSLPSTTTSTDNPNGANYGNGFTCRSGSNCDDNAPPPLWVQEKVDLTDYAGKRTLIRFEYITDGIYAAPGFAIDDISIPEINFFDNAEQGENGWMAQGFDLMDNVLAQRFIVQAIEISSASDEVMVVPIALDAANKGKFTTSGLGTRISRVVIVISGDTPVTWETANYSFDVQ